MGLKVQSVAVCCLVVALRSAGNDVMETFRGRTQGLNYRTRSVFKDQSRVITYQHITGRFSEGHH